MYSPKISKVLVPQLYQLSKQQGLPMTRLIDEILREAMERYGQEPERKER